MQDSADKYVRWDIPFLVYNPLVILKNNIYKLKTGRINYIFHKDGKIDETCFIGSMETYSGPNIFGALNNVLVIEYNHVMEFEEFKYIFDNFTYFSFIGEIPANSLLVLTSDNKLGFASIITGKIELPVFHDMFMWGIFRRYGYERVLELKNGRLVFEKCTFYESDLRDVNIYVKNDVYAKFSHENYRLIKGYFARNTGAITKPAIKY